MCEKVEITRDEFESLKARVSALEEKIEGKDVSPSAKKETGLDHRDAAVIAEMEHGKSYSPLQIKRMFKTHTDIRQDETAKQRAKTLTKKDVLKRDGQRYIYRGE